ncbi:nucleoside diphosphate-linked moiety X motif 19 [Orussus abietinus]|uniref:nucleoside diphosphate-linked moiety X motif 19 n=1 Tax=Orussus abietinus TaxID=222816 RepID=UPI000625DBFF|nr:nucleoside diphosphate-linked moiety X motif 19 [Orussus abietinus]
MKAWKNSASLILAVRHNSQFDQALACQSCNYRLLCLKRQETSSFMPGAYVFPGGLTEIADADLKWQKLFLKFGLTNNFFTSLLPQSDNRPLIFKSEPNELRKEISLRITAIRETFEESGILLCRQKKDPEDLKWGQYIEGEEVNSWQIKVQKDASKFYEMCESLQCVPDLWALQEWSNWLTPAFLDKKRYNTIFYFAALPTLPQTKLQHTEMADLQWDYPNNFLSNADIFLPSPQLYEITRMSKFKQINDLFKCAILRNSIGTQLWLPVKVSLANGFVAILPGDSMYPAKVDLIKTEAIIEDNKTIEDFQRISFVKNRIEFHDSGERRIVVENFKSIEENVSSML